VVQILGLGMTTVPLSTIMFRFLPAEQSSNAAGIYALVRNEGGSIGIALSSTFLQRAQQMHQTYLGARLSAANPAVQALVASRPHELELLYQQVQQQSSLLAYMDQYRMFAYLLACLLPLVLLLKRPPRVIGKIELEAH
jgi:DHA2 family multidrug resistance protein